MTSRRPAPGCGRDGEIALLKDATAIVGIGETEFAKRLEPSEKALACRAILAALDDAGIAPGEVDGFASYTMETNDEVEIAKNIGAGEVTFFSQIHYGGGAGPGCVGHLAMAVATGQCEVGVAWRSRKRGSGQRPWAARCRRAPRPPGRAPTGLLRPVDEIAMLTRRYMHEVGATRDHLANVALAVRRAANRNPRAIMHGKTLSREQYMAARWISEPLCLFDNCLESDGALACVVVVSAERARDCRHEAGLRSRLRPGNPATARRRWSTTGATIHCSVPAWIVREAAVCGHSDIRAEDIDVAQIYDAFSPLIPLSLEGYGVCERGEGAGVHRGRQPRARRAPPDQHLRRRTLRGLRPRLQPDQRGRPPAARRLDQPVEGARTCLVTAGEGVPTSALLLRN